MKRIIYPSDTQKLKQFHLRYLSALKKTNVAEIDRHLAKAAPYKKKPLTFAILAVLPFDELLRVEKILRIYANTCDVSVTRTKKGVSVTVIENDFLDLFDYEANDGGISDFFLSEEHLKLKTCHYCGIDYINAFKDFGDYLGPLDFLNNADMTDLQFIHRLGEKTAQRIIKTRSIKKIKDINDVQLNKDVKSAIQSFNFTNSHSHFTLDHVFPKSRYKFFSLCLYNLVPSCYSCNSKFKHIREFVIDKNILQISPTSKWYRLTDDFTFQIRYAGALKDITKTSDFAIKLVPSSNHKQLDNYIKIFKLNGRYAFHKSEVLKMIKDKIQNPKSEIAKKAVLLKMTPLDITKFIHGRELFIENSDNPMHKFKRDIAKGLNIIC